MDLGRSAHSKRVTCTEFHCIVISTTRVERRGHGVGPWNTAVHVCGELSSSAGGSFALGSYESQQRLSVVRHSTKDVDKGRV